MKVAFYNHTSVVSGAEISLLLTVSHMQQAEPVLFAPEGELLERARKLGLPVVPIPGYRARRSRNPLRLMRDVCGMLWAGWKFSQAVKRHGADLIHANSLRAGIMASLYVWLHRRPLIWHVRDNPPPGFMGRAINRLAAATVKAVIGISRSVLGGFDERRLAEKMKLVHNGVEFCEITEFERRFHRKRLREELRTPPDGKVAAVIGQITPWKRQADAIVALKKLLLRGHDVYLWIVGEAKFREENKLYGESLRRLAQDMDVLDRVRFTGFRTDVTEICCAADLLFLCSDNEPFGRILIEAMSQAVPVIATNAGGVPEIVEHDCCGLLYEVGDTNGLTACADRLLLNDGERKRMGLQAMNRVKEHFTIRGTVSKIEDVYRAVIS